jgi:anti-sigma B factor antagonist
MAERGGVPEPRGNGGAGDGGSSGAGDGGGAGVMRVGLRRDGAAAVLAVSGEVDMATAPRLRRDVLAALRDAPEALVLDLTGVTFLGSAGLTVLVEARRSAGTALRVAAGHAARRTIEVAGLTALFSVHPTVAAALAP